MSGGHSSEGKVRLGPMDASPDRLAQMLRSVPGFSSASEDELRAVVATASTRMAEASSIVFEEGDLADGLYIVLSGSVRVVGDENTDPLGPGDIFGEIALVHDIPRTRAIEAAVDTELLVIPKAVFDGLFASNEELGRVVREKIRERLPEYAL